jgi:predicted RNA binding protein YcfA (HicA-like mRNA interferase family)
MGRSKLPTCSQARVVRALRKLGLQPLTNSQGKSRGKGSHVAFRGPNGRPVIVQDGDLPPSFVKTILNQLGIDEQTFLDAL